jgi:hypothetical protein
MKLLRSLVGTILLIAASAWAAKTLPEDVRVAMEKSGMTAQAPTKFYRVEDVKKIDSLNKVTENVLKDRIAVEDLMIDSLELAYMELYAITSKCVQDEQDILHLEPRKVFVTPRIDYNKIADSVNAARMKHLKQDTHQYKIQALPWK